jgi:dethiobiotin synthetase
MTSFPESIFVTGTDTGVGKTVITSALAWTLMQAGSKVSVMKPVQTGTNEPGLTDLEFVETVLGASFNSEDNSPYSFPEPLAPLTASRFAGRKIDIDKIKRAFEKLRSASDTVIVEGAGGLLVPILENYLMSDLALELGIPVLIVARPDLGTLNHTLLTVESARTRGLDVLGVVISNFPPSPCKAESTNPELITRLSGVPIVGVYPRDSSISVEQGKIGKIREVAPSTLSPLLAGTFDANEFLSGLAKTD